MKINKLSLDLIVDDVSRSIGFYTELGFEKIMGDSNFAKLKAGTSEIMLMLKSDFEKEVPSLNRPKNEGLFVLVIEVEDIEEIYEKIKNRINLLRELQSTDYGTKEFMFEDPDGYLVQFTQH